ncbi:hypothetical protein FNH22_14760 [Fulvivirga sp. M361]|uniref:hypothetical protein n=1 Tax=Fulvivirga sp. M361 TaxID=2594266 RepID=UPI001179D0A3|nr:hypothetical protein [Fulvivirga sp. M361]TRX57670.1 hypothetical protein FNH22_14760 [Fulvivirga sp. M361]
MVKIGFYLLSALMTGSVVLMFSKVSKATGQERQRSIRNFLTGISIWSVYIVALSTTGVLNDFGLPPRMPLLVVIPAFVIIFFSTSRAQMKKMIHSTPKSFPVYIQSFRVIVELLIYGAFMEGVFPKAVTFEGTNFDILAGISAPVIAFLHHKNRLSDRGVFFWNILSLCILTVTVVTFITAFYFSTHTPDIAFCKFFELPYILLPAMLLPYAVFYHVVSIRQLKRKK